MQGSTSLPDGRWIRRRRLADSSSGGNCSASFERAALDYEGADRRAIVLLCGRASDRLEARRLDYRRRSGHRIATATFRSRRNCVATGDRGCDWISSLLSPGFARKSTQPKRECSREKYRGSSVCEPEQG